VKQRADSTPEAGIVLVRRDAQRSCPSKIFSELRVVVSEPVQVRGQLSRTGKVVDVDVSMRRRNFAVVGPQRSHHDRQHATPVQKNRQKKWQTSGADPKILKGGGVKDNL